MPTTHIKFYAKLSYVMSVINYYKRLFVMNYNYGLSCVDLCLSGPTSSNIDNSQKSDTNLDCKVLITFGVIGQYYLGFGVQITSYDRKTISLIDMINNHSQYSYSCQKSYINVWIISVIITPFSFLKYDPA